MPSTQDETVKWQVLPAGNSQSVVKVGKSLHCKAAFPNGGTCQVPWEPREGRAKLFWVVRGGSLEDRITRAVGEVLEHGKSRDAWQSRVHLRICERLG